MSGNGDTLGTSLTVWEEGGSYYTVDVADEPRIDAAVSRYMETGRDSLLALTFTDGREYRVKASQITHWAVSTPETRQRAVELDKAQDEETQRFKREAGIWEDS